MVNSRPTICAHQDKAQCAKLVHKGLFRPGLGSLSGLMSRSGLMVLMMCVGLPAAVAASETSNPLVPTGTLRVVINLGNSILARKDAQSGDPVGVSVDLVTRESADVGFFAIDPVRGQGIAFTPAYLQIEGSYLVRENSPIKANHKVDRAGHRIAVGRGSAYDLFLTREIKSAELVRAETSPLVVRYFVDNNVEVAAGVRQQLESDARSFPGLRLLEGRQFGADMKSSGFVAATLKRHGIEGAVVAS